MPNTEKAARARRKLGRIFKGAVPDSPELRRIMAIPRRKWSEEEISEAIEVLTSYLRKEEGTKTLRPLQAVGLVEVHDYGRGIFGPIFVGKGKTLLSFLIPVVIEAKRPLLLVPAKLRKKTEFEFGELDKHWKSHPNLVIESYQRISHKYGAERLAEYNPDILIFDEAHRLKNPRAACTRKIIRWMEDHPQTRVVAMSGTMTRRSLLDFAHIARWCTPPDLYPLPYSDIELAAWAAAVDEIKPHEKRMQGGVGALALLHPEVGERVLITRDEVREAVRSRLHETPTVVAATDTDVAASLNIVLTRVNGYNARIEKLAADLNEGVKPNGDPITEKDLASRWATMRTLTSDFWYQWDPPPPEPWMAKRAKWKKQVRTLISQEIPGLESEGLIAIAAKAGKLGRLLEEDYRAWTSIRPTYKENVVPVWEDNRMLKQVMSWVNDHCGIVWVSEVALGQRLEKELKLPFFHRMGLDRKGRLIDTVSSTGVKGDCIIASVESNFEGRNLQLWWNDNLITTPCPVGTVWEQLLGRTHRDGQEADEVWVEVLIGCLVELECWYQARKEAHYESLLEGPKKLNYATVDESSMRFGRLSQSHLWQ